MNIFQWVDVASSVGTVAAAIIAAISIKIIRDQNKKQYRPRITISDTSYNVIINDHFGWEEAYIKKEHQKMIELPLLNVGNGVATHLVVRWVYNYDNMIETANKELRRAGRDVVFERDGYWLKLSSGKSMRSIVRGPNNSNHKIDYIAPVAVQSNGKNIPVDFALQELTAAPVSAFNQYEENGNQVNASYNLNLVIDYLDTLGNKYTDNIPMKLYIAMWKKEKDGSHAEFTFRIERVIL